MPPYKGGKNRRRPGRRPRGPRRPAQERVCDDDATATTTILSGAELLLLLRQLKEDCCRMSDGDNNVGTAANSKVVCGASSSSSSFKTPARPTAPRKLRPREKSPVTTASSEDDDDDGAPSSAKKRKRPKTSPAEKQALKEKEEAIRAALGKKAVEARTLRTREWKDVKERKTSLMFAHYVGRTSRGVKKVGKEFFHETKLADIPQRKPRDTYQRIYYWGDGMGTCRGNQMEFFAQIEDHLKRSCEQDGNIKFPADHRDHQGVRRLPACAGWTSSSLDMFVDSARVMWRWLRQGEMPEYLAEWKERKRRLKWSERPYYTPPRLLSLEEVAVIEKTNPSNVNDNADDEEEKEEDDDEEEEEEVVVVEDEEADALENLSEQQRHERELALEKEEPPPSTAVASPAAAVEAKVIFLIISIYLLED
jgi:hypothetical protein